MQVLFDATSAKSGDDHPLKANISNLWLVIWQFFFFIPVISPKLKNAEIKKIENIVSLKKLQLCTNFIAFKITKNKKFSILHFH